MSLQTLRNSTLYPPRLPLSGLRDKRLRSLVSKKKEGGGQKRQTDFPVSTIDLLAFNHSTCQSTRTSHQSITVNKKSNLIKVSSNPFLTITKSPLDKA